MVKVYHFFKRIFDFLFAVILLIILSPFLILISFAIYLSDGKPVFFLNKRVGKNKRLFTAIKFRTLKKGTKRGKYGVASEKNSISKFAEFMRETHLDEITQLVNIIKGDMSFIGPRPLDLQRYYYLHRKDNKWDSIFKIKPGMTCLNQVARYSESCLKKVKNLKGLSKMNKRNRLLLDRYYIRNESFILDFKIIMWTAEYLITGFFRKMHILK